MGVALEAAPSGSSSSDPVTVQVVNSSGVGLSIFVTIPGFISGKHEDANGCFTTLGLPDAGVLSEIGKPALPVIRRLIMAPNNGEVSCVYTGSLQKTSLLALGLPGKVMPVQPPIPKILGAMESAAFVQDPALYASMESYPANPVKLTEAGTLFGRRLLSLEICPIVTIPSTGGLTVYSNLAVTVTFAKGQILSSESGLIAWEQANLQAAVLNPPPPAEILTGTQKRLLIIAPAIFSNNLVPFITHKMSRGWGVDLFDTNSTGTATAQIQGFIKARYTNSATRPSALLLVGDTPQIPQFTGTAVDAPDTDLYYGCMDGSNDWQPEFPVGRFSVSTTNQLAAVVAKTITHELSPLDSWIKCATFLASWDNYAVSEGTHNEVISSVLASLGYTSAKLYSYSNYATSTQVRNAINKGCAWVIYSGHGDFNCWADGPFFTTGDVNALANTLHYPVVCSFACLTGEFGLPECFAETWLRAPARGAAAVLASSVTSYWSQDDILEKSLFKAIFTENQPLLGTAIWRAKQLYLTIYGATDPTTRRYFEQYNLFGDPTLETVGLPVLTNGIPEVWFTSHGITNTNYYLELQKDQDGDGMTALQEYLAGTDPHDAASVLRLVNGGVANGKVTLRWLSSQSLLAPQSPYQIWVCTNLSTGSWLLQTNLLTRTPPTNEVQWTVPQYVPQLFYRVSLTN